MTQAVFPLYRTIVEIYLVAVLSLIDVVRARFRVTRPNISRILRRMICEAGKRYGSIARLDSSGSTKE